jgi:transposase-like protein
VKYGTMPDGEQRYLCNHINCEKKTFLLSYKYNGRLPEVKNKIIDMALNGSGIRDTARVLKISPTTVIEVLKKRNLSYIM